MSTLAHALHAPAARAALCRTGLWLFILSEAMIFVLLLTVRFVLAGGGHPAALNQPLAVLMTVVLLASGWPAHRARRALARGDHRGLRGWVGLTLGLGGLFLVGMAVEWAELAVSPGSLYGTAFFTTTGAHGLHVLAGLLVWGSVLLRARREPVEAEAAWAVEAAERYWHFVDVVWGFIYPVFYLA